MKIQIRKGVFETNSSSIHTLCIPKRNDLINIPAGITLTFSLGEYGWGPEEIIDPNGKASYLWTCLYVRQDNVLRLQSYKQLIEDTLTPFEISCVFEEEDENSRFYIDHAAELDDLSVILHDSNLLIKYLFGDGRVYVDNDNGSNYEEIIFDEDGNNKLEKDYILFEKGN